MDVDFAWTHGTVTGMPAPPAIEPWLDLVGERGEPQPDASHLGPLDGPVRRRPDPTPACCAASDEVLLGELLDLARQQVGAGVAFVGRWEGQLRIMRAVSAPELSSPRVRVGAAEPLVQTLCKRIVDGRLPRVINDASEHAAVVELPEPVRAGIGSYVGVPILLRDGALYGTLCCLSDRPDPGLADRDADFLVAVAASMARVLQAEVDGQAVQRDLLRRLEPLLAGEDTTMVFQPVLSTRTGAVVGSEALARFAGGSGRSTAQWFDDADRAGVGTALELLTARTALAQAGRLPGRLALNFSATTLLDPGFGELFAQADPTRIMVEVSEHEQVEDYAAVADILHPWRERGLRVAVDDAGAGFASLRHVLLLVPDVIKLDVSLIHGIDVDPVRQALAEAVAGFAGRTGAQVVAEGVETAAEHAAVRATGIGLVQGWHLGAGVPAPEFLARWGRPAEFSSVRPAGRRRTPRSRSAR